MRGCLKIDMANENKKDNFIMDRPELHKEEKKN